MRTSFFIPIIALGAAGGLLAWLQLKLHPAPIESAGPLTVELVGREFTWRYRYPGRDGRFDTADDVKADDALRLPAASDVLLLLRSEDYVYTCSIPSLDKREIAVPEMTHQLALRTPAESSHRLIADPLCAVRLFHDEDMGRLRIMPTVDFYTWYSRQ